MIKAKNASGLATLYDAIEGGSEGEGINPVTGSSMLCGVEVIHLGLGRITESDIRLASAAHHSGSRRHSFNPNSCHVFGLDVRADARARKVAKHERVQVHVHHDLASLIGALEELGDPARE